MPEIQFSYTVIVANIFTADLCVQAVIAEANINVFLIGVQKSPVITFYRPQPEDCSCLSLNVFTKTLHEPLDKIWIKLWK